MKVFVFSKGFIAGFSVVYLLEFILSMASIIGGTAEKPTLIFVIENLALGFLTAVVGGIVGTRMYGRWKQHLGKAIGFYSFMAVFLIYFGLSLLSSLDSEGFAEAFLLLIWPALIILGLIGWTDVLGNPIIGWIFSTGTWFSWGYLGYLLGWSVGFLCQILLRRPIPNTLGSSHLGKLFMRMNSLLSRTIAILFLGPIIVISAASFIYSGIGFVPIGISFFLFPSVGIGIHLVFRGLIATILAALTLYFYLVLKNLFALHKKD